MQKDPAQVSGVFFRSGAEGTRTPDPLHAMQVRYQLRHSPGFVDFPVKFFSSRRSNSSILTTIHREAKSANRELRHPRAVAYQ